MATYTYTKTIDSVSVDQLAEEVLSSISKRCIKQTPGDVIDGSILFLNDGSADNLVFDFPVALSGGEETSLDGVVSSHTPSDSFDLPSDFSRAPLATDDRTEGFRIGSEWIHDGTIYVCTDDVDGAAVWEITSTNHTHDSSDIGDFNSAADARITNAAGDSLATLVAGKIPTGQIPSIAITNVSSVADITARNALTPEEGDFVIVADAGSGDPAKYIYDGSSWVDVSDGSSVDSVNGETGIVVLDTDDVNEGSTNLYYTEGRVSANTNVSTNTTHGGLTNNPHSVTKSQVSLGNVTNDAQLKRAAGDINTFTEKATPVSADLIIVEDSADSNNKKKVQIGNLPSGGGSVFGSEFAFAEDLSVSTTTSSSWQEKMTMAVTGLPSGTYRIGWSYQWNFNLGSTDFECRIHLDNTTVLMEHKQEPKDVGGSFGSTGTDQMHQVGGHAHVVLSGDHDIDVDWASSDGSTSSSIWNVRLEFWRVL